MEQLEPRLVLAGTVQWAVDSDGFWDVATNWLDDQGVNRVPNDSDDVIINRGAADPVVTVRTDPALAGTLHSEEEILISGGSRLLVTAASEVGGTITVDGGSLDARGQVTATGQIRLLAGLLRGSGGVIVANGAMLSIEGAAGKSVNYGSLELAGTATHTGTGTFNISSPFNIVSGGVYDVQDDNANFAGNGDLNNEGTFRKSGGTGETIVAVDFNNAPGGIVDVQSGQVTLSDNGSRSTGGTFQVADGAVLDLTGGSNIYYEGTYTGSGAGTVQVTGGQFLTTGTGVTFDFPAGMFQWTGGTLFSRDTRPITNLGTIELSGATGNGMADSSVLINEGTVVQSNGGDLTSSRATIRNQAGALWDIRTDSGIAPYANRVTFENRGTFRKSAGTGESIIVADFDNLGGTVDVQAGTVVFTGAGDSTGGVYNVAGGANIELDRGAGNAPSFEGNYTGSGGGRIELSEGRINTAGGGAIFDFPAGMFHWTGGQIGTLGAGPFTNAGVMELSGPTEMPLADRAEFHNAGTVLYTGAGDLTGSRNTIRNLPGALWDLQTDAVIRGVTPAYNGGVDFVNDGTVRKSAGVLSQFDADFNNQPTGVVELQAGRLKIAERGQSTGGHFDLAGGTVLEFATQYLYSLAGEYTGSGTGRIELTGSFSGDNNDPPHFNFPEGLFHWIAGARGSSIGPFVNDGFITFPDGAVPAHRGYVVNNGTIIHEGATLFQFLQTSTLDNNGLWDLRGDGDIQIIDYRGAGSNFNNYGTIRKSAGVGESRLFANLGSTSHFNIEGSLEVQSGTVSIDANLDQHDGTSLTGGTWYVGPLTTLDFVNGAGIVTNQGDVTLDGPNSTFAAIDTIAANEGSFALADGRDFATVGDFTNTGHTTVGPGSTLTVNGAFSEGGANTTEFAIAGDPASGEFGQVNASGQADLSGVLRVTLDGYGPTSGEVYQLMSYTSRVGGEPLIAGLDPFFTANVTDTAVTLDAVASATDIALDGANITVPANAAPGEEITISWTPDNLEDIAVAGDWTDSVYLSRDVTFSGDDLLIGRKLHTGGVAGLSNYTESLTAPLPAVEDGSYHVIVIVDTQNDFPDNDRSNNTAASAGLIDVAVPELQFDTLFQGTVDRDESRYFRLDVPAGGDVRLTANFAQSRQAEFFVSYNQMPTRSDFDFTAPDIASLNRILRLTSPQAGPYYVLLYGRESAAGGQAFDLLAERLGFVVDTVSPGIGTNVSRATLTLDGAGFTPQMQVDLLDQQGGVAASALVEYVSENRVFAVFDTRNVSTGVYDVRGTDTAGTTVADDAFEVLGEGQVVHADGVLAVAMTAPSSTRSGIGTLTITYANTGGADIVAPVMFLSSDIYQFRLPGEEKYRGSFMQLLGINFDGPAGILPAGGRGQIEVEFNAAGGAPQFDRFSLLVPGAGQPIDWFGSVPFPELELATPPVPVPVSTSGGPGGSGDSILPTVEPYSFPDGQSLKSVLRPVSVHPEAWDVIFDNFVAQVGDTFGQWEFVLSGDANYLSNLGIYTPDVDRLLAFELLQASGFGAINQRFIQGTMGRGNPDPTNFTYRVRQDGNILVNYGNVTYRLFERVSSSTWQGVDGDLGVVTKVGDDYELRESDGTIVRFGIITYGGSTGPFWRYTEDPNGIRTWPEYGTSGLTAITNSLGDTISYNFEYLTPTTPLRLTRVTDPVGRTADFVYDATYEHLVEVHNPDGVTTYTYVTDENLASHHAITSVTYPDGTRIDTTYDDRGRPIRHSYGDGSLPIDISYGTSGEITVTTDSGGQTTLYLDDFGHVRRVTDALGQTVDYQFGPTGDLLEILLPGRLTTTFEYDDRHNLISSTNPLGHTVNASFDQQFNQVQQVGDALGHVLSFEHDERSNLTAIVYPDGSSEQFEYDTRGLAVQSQARNGELTEFTYNAAGLPIRTVFDDGSEVTYAYDEHYNLVTVVDASGITEVEYDSRDLPTRVTYPNGRLIEYDYDAGGRRVQMRTGDGFEVNYAYDSMGQLTGLTDGDAGTIVQYAYDNGGRLIREDKGNGTYTTYSYDLAGSTTEIVHRAPDDSILERFDYEYDDLGNVTQVTTLQGDFSYDYDSLGQLTRVVTPAGRTIEYEYDAAGNRIAVTDGGVRTDYAANLLNQYSTIGDTTYTYDLNGYLEQRSANSGDTNFEYDAIGRLVQVTTPAGTWAYEYDAFGYRSAVIHDGQRTDLLVDPLGISEVVAEYHDGADGVYYAHGLGLVARTDANGSPAFYSFDRSGNTSLMTDAGGAVVNQYAVLPFGEVAAVSETIPNPFVFAGGLGVMQDESGLVYMTNRWYDSEAGRFTQPDPIGISGGDLNLYRYVANNPVSYADPPGLDDWGSRLGPQTYHLQTEQPQTRPQALGNEPAGYNGKEFTAQRQAKFGTKTEWSGKPVYEGPIEARPTHAQRVKYFEETFEVTKREASRLASDEYARQARSTNTKVPQTKPNATTATSSTPKTGGRISGRVKAVGGVVVGIVVSETVLNPYFYEYVGLSEPESNSQPFGPRALEEDARSAYEEAHQELKDRYLCDKILTLVYSEQGGPSLPRETWDQFYELFGTRDLNEIIKRCKEIVVRRAGDPNDVVGPEGYGAERFVPPGEVMPYTVLFENMPTVNAPAQEIVISQQLDDDLDWTTFQLGEFGFGDLVVPVPDGRNYYQTRIDLTDTLGFYVDFEAGIDLGTGLATWHLIAIDPATGDLITDPDGGFLPPNVTPPEGDGFVDYSIRSKDDLATGTTIDAQATIIFDPFYGQNPPIDTPTFTNTIDGSPPESQVALLPGLANAPFTVSWSGSDHAGSGVRYYEVYASTDGSQPYLVQLATASTTVEFDAEAGHTYAFYSRAGDHVGNLEPLSSLPDSIITIGPYRWHNYADAFDVDGVNGAQPIDVLTLINYINAHPGDASLPTLPTAPPPFYDVYPDDLAIPLDVIQLINHINSQYSGGGEAEALASPDARIPWFPTTPDPVESFVQLRQDRTGTVSESAEEPKVIFRAEDDGLSQPLDSRADTVLAVAKTPADRDANDGSLESILDDLAVDVGTAWGPLE